MKLFIEIIERLMTLTGHDSDPELNEKINRVMSVYHETPDPDYIHIIEIVCKHNKLTQSELFNNNKSRKQEYVIARQEIMYFYKLRANKSLRQCGLIFNLDHSTANHAVKTIRNLIETDKEERMKLIKIELDCDIIEAEINQKTPKKQ